MKKIILTFLYCTIVIMTADAQVKLNCDSTAIAKKYLQNAMYLKQGFFGTDFERNGGTYSVGLFNSNLKSAFIERKISPMTLKELQKSTTNQIVSTALIVGSLIPILFIKPTSSNSVKQTLALTFFGGLIASVPFSVISVNQRSRAVWLYNKDVMSRE